ncbi:MAG: hypothetical protein SWQ30_02730 [Thermodesulfobacteriota bacterium]|nr:hypothetical protein [Thermodesulfobacteriota bacterium]
MKAKKKADRRPKWGLWDVADILYGEPAYSSIERGVEAGRIVLGGCVITDNDPAWQCVDCGAQIYEETYREL